MTRPFNLLMNRGDVPAQRVLALIKLLVMPKLKLAQIGESVKEIIIASRCPESAVPRSIGTPLCQHVSLPTKHNIPPSASSLQLRPHRWETLQLFFPNITHVPVFSARGGRWEEELAWNYFGGGCCTRSEIFTPDIHKAWASVKLWVADINKNGKPPAGLQCLDWTALPPSWDRDLLGIADESHRRWHVDPPRQWIKE